MYCKYQKMFLNILIILAIHMYIGMCQIFLTRVEGKTHQRHTPLQPIPLLPSSSLPIHSSPYSSASLTFNQKRLGRQTKPERGGQGEAGKAKKHARARKQDQVGQEARKEARKESQIKES